MAHEAGVDRFLGWRQVRDLTGLGRTTAWRMRCAGDFPQPVPISPGRVAWRERDIVAWNESRGALIPVRPRPVAKPPNRAPETRTLPLVGAEPAVGTMSPDAQTCSSASTVRRRRAARVRLLVSKIPGGLAQAHRAPTVIEGWRG